MTLQRASTDGCPAGALWFCEQYCTVKRRGFWDSSRPGPCPRVAESQFKRKSRRCWSSVATFSPAAVPGCFSASTCLVLSTASKSGNL